MSMTLGVGLGGAYLTPCWWWVYSLYTGRRTHHTAYYSKRQAFDAVAAVGMRASHN